MERKKLLSLVLVLLLSSAFKNQAMELTEEEQLLIALEESKASDQMNQHASGTARLCIDGEELYDFAAEGKTLDEVDQQLAQAVKASLETYQAKQGKTQLANDEAFARELQAQLEKGDAGNPEPAVQNLSEEEQFALAVEESELEAVKALSEQEDEGTLQLRRRGAQQKSSSNSRQMQAQIIAAEARHKALEARMGELAQEKEKRDKGRTLAAEKKAREGAEPLRKYLNVLSDNLLYVARTDMPDYHECYLYDSCVKEIREALLGRRGNADLSLRLMIVGAIMAQIEEAIAKQLIVKQTGEEDGFDIVIQGVMKKADDKVSRDGAIRTIINLHMEDSYVRNTASLHHQAVYATHKDELKKLMQTFLAPEVLNHFIRVEKQYFGSKYYIEKDDLLKVANQYLRLVERVVRLILLKDNSRLSELKEASAKLQKIVAAFQENDTISQAIKKLLAHQS